MIKIVFYPGTHGHYVEYVLNKMLHGDKIVELDDFFGTLGTSHKIKSNKSYIQHKTFGCFGALFQEGAGIILDKLDSEEFFILINPEEDDDLTAMQLRLKRGSDLNIDPDELHHNTYHKLDDIKYTEMIECINRYFSIKPYYNIKDPSWTDIESIEDFHNLPDYIKNECIDVFGFNPVYINSQYPDAPKWVLKCIFKSWFYDSMQRPFSVMQKYVNFKNVYKLNYRNLYNADKFKKDIQNIMAQLNLKFDPGNFSNSLHSEFVSRVPYLALKDQYMAILKFLNDGIDQPIPELNSVEQAYLDFKIEKTFNIIMPEEKQEYFTSTGEILEYIKSTLKVIPDENS